MAPEEDQPELGTQAVLNALTAAAGWRLGGVLGAATGAAAAPYLVALVDKVRAEWQQDQRANIAEMAHAAGQAANLNPDALGECMGQSPRTRLLTATAAEAAAKTAWPPKVVAIGRALAAGLLATDAARIDTQPLIMAALAEIEAPHASLLELLVRRWPADSAGGTVGKLLPPRDPGIPWTAGPRNWLPAEIAEARPNLRPVLPSLLGTLQRHGLAARGEQAADPFGRTGRDMQRRFMSDIAEKQQTGTLGPDPRTIQIPATALSWLPTELGEEVLDELLAAGAEFTG